MRIKSIEIENFLSIEKAFFNFEKHSGITRVMGENKDTTPHSSNGAGKSTIIEAVVFALFGKTIRKTTEKSITNNITKGKCKVVLRVNDKVVITRTKKPPVLILEVGGVSETKEGIQETQEYLETLLNTNYNVFLASLVFGQHNTTNFLESTPETKRAMIQNFLNVTDIFRFRPRIRSLKTKYNTEKKIAATLQAESLQKANGIKKKLKKLAKNKKEGVSLLLEKDIEVDKYSVAEIQSLEREKAQMDLKLRDKEHTLTRVRNTINRLTKESKHLKGNSSCEHCGGFPQVIQDTLRENEDNVKTLRLKEKSLRKGLQKLKKDIDDTYIPISAADLEVIESLKSLDVEVEVLKKDLKAQQRMSRKYSTQMADAQKRYDLMRFWETAFSEQGLVKYLIRHVLDFFNERTNHYVSTLTNSTFSIKFNDLLEESIYNKKHKCYYESLSGGEKTKIGLSVMMALNDLLTLSGKERSNIVFFDEVAESLDQEGVKGLHTLLEEISKGKSVFLVTHNTYLNSLIEDQSSEVFVMKEKGITRINQGNKNDKTIWKKAARKKSGSITRD